MMDRREHLFEVLDNLIRIRNECSGMIFAECGLADLTARQIAYLQTIGEEEDLTPGRFAEITGNSKPTITGMVDRFVLMACVQRERCPGDGRIQYIRLTQKGQEVAMAEDAALRRVIERMEEVLDEDDLDLLIRLLRKVR
jgi:DNA-binding MarR family transcriptional regulator